MENKQLTKQQFFNQDIIQAKFKELLGKRAPQFITSVMQVVSSNKLLGQASNESIFQAAAMAATLDLPINQNLGFAWIVPYKGQGQFQMGWRGFVQLALRTGEYSKINVVDVYENQFKGFNALTEELDADFSMPGSGGVVGYAAFFRLKSGFEKVCYWNREQVVKHAKKYSQAYSSKFSPWSDESTFDAMAKKTVLKNTLSKWGIMSIEMQKATIGDQAVIEDVDSLDVNYIDRLRKGVDVEGKLEERVTLLINDCDSPEALHVLSDSFLEQGVVLTEEQQGLFNEKIKDLK